MNCPKCSTTLSQQDIFAGACPNCSAAIKNESAEPVNPSPYVLAELRGIKNELEEMNRRSTALVNSFTIRAVAAVAVILFGISTTDETVIAICGVAAILLVRNFNTYSVGPKKPL